MNILPGFFSADFSDRITADSYAGSPGNCPREIPTEQGGMNMGFLLVAIASVILGIYPSVQKGILLSGVSPLSLVVICNASAGAFAALLGTVRKESFRVDRRTLLQLAAVGILGLFLTDYLLNVAYTMIPVGFTTMIHFFYPALVCLVMTVVFREKMTGWKAGAVLLSVLGLFLISGGRFSGRKIGILVALVTSFAYAFYMIANEKSRTAWLSPMVRAAYYNLFVTLAALAVSAIRGEYSFPKTAVHWSLAILVGILLSASAMLLFAGIGRLGAGRASFINMLEPVTSIVVSMLVYRDQVSFLSILGCVLILAALLLISFGGVRKGSRAEEET